MWSQQFIGGRIQYANTYTYGVSEQTTNGFHAALYTGGGLVDVRQLEAQRRRTHDTLFLGIAQVQEALLMGTGADLFGDLVYSHALTGQAEPTARPAARRLRLGAGAAVARDREPGGDGPDEPRAG